MVNRREIYGPLEERTVENYQVQYLARRYDFGKESRIATMLVKRINEEITKAEKAVGISRVKPFEMYLKKGKKQITLPLFKPSYLEPIYEGETFNDCRRLIEKEIMEKTEEIDVAVSKEEMMRIINPWSYAKRSGPTTYTEGLKKQPNNFDETDSKRWDEFIRKINPKQPKERMETPDISAPERVNQRLIKMVSEETGLGKNVSKHLVEDVILLRNLCCPRTESLKSGEMVLLVTHVRAYLSQEVATRFRRLAPVVITVLTQEEMKRIPTNVPEALNLLKKRIIRVCFEAYKQNGLLTMMELQWIFQISSTRISELIRTFQNEHNIVVPTPGTILDAGRSMTHKDIIVRLHLEGYSVKEIARITHHSPKAVDNYVGTFESVLILYLYNIPTHLMARSLEKGVTLIKEYLKLIEEYYRDKTEIRKYLIAQGVRF
ncbi:DUF1670 domain-containing protein [Petrotoga sp. 9PWA.NaAc.5.4]|uniref:DUF1670 domain-containing protein n=1 Tax=Petrotoga sp. 9PWA.NaAc.5.4 TaxID=1434328 RepID=UPI000CB9E8E7|nr:DUF1670 domain-containing protein [Petrotoga sp. 9PWA.NaAc.5.4]PNR96605.1 hypothetical protein X924_01465 [Petrotoga sp. 9PWA.NaAc.5.4]